MKPTKSVSNSLQRDRRRAGRWARVLGIALVAACDSTAPAVPGNVRAIVESPAGAEGSAMLEFRGGGIREVRAIAGEVFEIVRGDTTRVIVLLRSPGQLGVSLDLGDVNTLPEWRILQVADGADRLRPDLSRYRVRFQR